MKRKINILCAMRDCRTAQALIRALDHEVRCSIRIVDNGDSVLEMARKIPPDILIIDAVLPMVDGFGAIDGLRAMLGERMPRIIGGSMLSFADSGFKKRGVMYLTRIPWDLPELLEMIYDAIREIDTHIDWTRVLVLQQQASNLLTKIGMKNTLRGYAYLACAAALACENEARLYAIGEELYKPVAMHFGTTVSAVERLIRHAVESTMDSEGVRSIYGFFGNTIDPTRGKPTNAQVIAMLAQRLRIDQVNIY